jgi:hypothetical protein
MTRTLRITCTEEVSQEPVSRPPRRIRMDVSNIDLELAGRKHWEELHTVQNPTEEWFADWLSRIPRYGCSCSKDFEAILKSFPVDYRIFFVWSVRVHNAVNQKLGKPIFSMEEAIARWAKNECDKCGACCRELRIEPITAEDINREPLLNVIDFGAKGCSMLCNDNTCSIYLTRPDVCRRFEPGSVACNLARSAAGLSDL